jgi:hypothetical protein
MSKRLAIRFEDYRLDHDMKKTSEPRKDGKLSAIRFGLEYDRVGVVSGKGNARGP